MYITNLVERARETVAVAQVTLKSHFTPLSPGCPAFLWPAARLSGFRGFAGEANAPFWGWVVVVPVANNHQGATTLARLGPNGAYLLTND